MFITIIIKNTLPIREINFYSIKPVKGLKHVFYHVENLMKKINEKVASGELCDASLEITGSHLADHLLPTADLRHAIGEAESDDPVMRKNHMEVGK